jgi:hypothetical protein
VYRKIGRNIRQEDRHQKTERYKIDKLTLTIRQSKACCTIEWHLSMKNDSEESLLRQGRNAGRKTGTKTEIHPGGEANIKQICKVSLY